MVSSTGWLSPADQRVFRGLVSCSWLKGTTWNDDSVFVSSKSLHRKPKNSFEKNLQRRKKHPKIGSLEHFQQPNHQSIIKNVVRLLSLADVPSRWKCSNSYLGSRSYPCSCSLQYLQLGRWPVLGKGYGLFVLQGVFSEGQNGVWGILWKMWADMLILFFLSDDYPFLINMNNAVYFS